MSYDVFFYTTDKCFSNFRVYIHTNSHSLSYFRFAPPTLRRYRLYEGETFCMVCALEKYVFKRKRYAACGSFEGRKGPSCNQRPFSGIDSGEEWKGGQNAIIAFPYPLPFCARRVTSLSLPLPPKLIKLSRSAGGTHTIHTHAGVGRGGLKWDIIFLHTGMKGVLGAQKGELIHRFEAA